MFKGFSKDAAYYALIGFFLIATIYLLSPALFRQVSLPTGGPSVISASNNFSAVNLTILYSSKCKAFCDTNRVEAALKSSLVNVKVERVDVETTAGKALANQFNVTLVPAYTFDSSVANNPAFPRFGTGLIKIGTNYLLVTSETTSGYLFQNHPSATPEITQFVASFNVKSLVFQNTTFETLKRFNNSINFTIHYAVRKVNGSFESISGYSELSEDALQLCAVQSGSPNALNAIACRSRAIMECYAANSPAVAFCAQFWKECIGGWGMDENATEQCVRTTNQTLLSKEANATLDNKITNIPTTIIGNQYRLVGQVNAFELFSSICAIYPRLSGCSIRISNS
ncbi:MAG: hypothetical protein Q8R15_04365 [Candidatus Micrarchaeota archaeon]|nr:hypothetical protein [Candidatus Micrarchaeota archaeon]